MLSLLLYKPKFGTPKGYPFAQLITTLNKAFCSMLRKQREGSSQSYEGDKKKYMWRASLVAQWLRICLLMQGTRVRALVWEDPTCHGAAGPVSHNC